MTSIKIVKVNRARTGTSKKVLRGFEKGLGLEANTYIDLTHSEAVTKSYSIPPDELVVFAVPVYGGRVPIVATQRLARARDYNRIMHSLRFMC